MKLKYIYLFIIFVFYIILPISILLGFLNFDHKFIYLTTGSLIIYSIMRITGAQNEKLGITSKQATKSIKDVSKFTLILAIAGVIIYFTGFGGRFTLTETTGFYLFYIFVSSPAQEFLYRGALVEMLQFFKVSEKSKMLTSSFLYSFVHIIYKDFWTMILTFLIGIIWYRCYRKTNNLLGVSISHAILGVVTILAGVID